MTALPKYLRHAPIVFYVLGVVAFVSSFALSYYDTFYVNPYGAPEYYSFSNPLIMSAVLRGLFSASIEAIWIVANGMLFHFLLFFWDRYASSDSSEATE